MRIAIDARYLNASHSALSQYCENLIEHLAKVDAENQYIVFIHNSFPKTLRLGDNFRVRKIWADPLSWRTLASFHTQIERSRADIAHALYPIVPLRYAGRLMVTVHDLKPYLLRETETDRLFFARQLYEWTARWMFPLAVRRAKWLAAVSNATRDALASHFPEARHKILVAQSGLEPSYLAPLEEATLELVLAKYRLPSRYILYCGGLRPSKNVPVLLEAFAQLRAADKRHADLCLALAVRPGRWLNELRRRIAALGIESVTRIYQQVADSERRAFYARAEVFCFPCCDEGFGFPVLEAQASRTPVVAARSGALPEVAGKGALLAEPGEVGSLADMLRRALVGGGEREALIEAGLRNAKRFTWTRTAEQIRDFYNMLM